MLQLHSFQRSMHACKLAQLQRNQAFRLGGLHVVAFAHYPTDMPGRHRMPIAEGLPLSLFHPYKRLPPDGTTVPLEEEQCDPEEERCTTPLHVYEAKCTSCSGTGWARAPSNGRRGHLGTCILCHGLGVVRRTTSRFCPDDPDKHLTINRPLTWNGKFAAHLGTLRHKASSSSSSSSSSGNGNGMAEGSNGSAANQSTSSYGLSGNSNGSDDRQASN